MTELHHRAKELFLEVREKPEAERAAWLEAVCDGDAALREEVESLLAAADGMPDCYLTPRGEVGLTPGVMLAHYRIRERLGSGGMGEVYAARDTELDRDVAIKVLPPRLAEEPARLARLRREAKVLASLNHPNIAAIHGLAEGPGVHGIVLELVEGPTLADRLQQGPVPLDEALAVARQICDALETAHEKGVVHRDLKPANVKLRPDGTVKVLDFGLAKAITEDGEGPGGSRTPTSTAESTREGLILGTPGYMSPEQARGQPVDKRTDIWAFGCVLYELLSGRTAFSAETTPDALAATLDRDPDWNSLPEATPVAVRRLLGRCLVKDPKQRLRDIGDARIEIGDALNGSDVELNATAEHAADGRRTARDRWLRRAALAGVMLAAVAATVAAWAWFGQHARVPAEPVRMTVSLPQGVSVARRGYAPPLALSPDGRTLVIAGTGEDGQLLYKRTLDRLEAIPLAGTEGGTSPFFSPDGEWIGFFADERLRRVPTAGGAAVDIAVAPGMIPGGASWGLDDRIVFASVARPVLYVVAAEGGDAVPLTTLDAQPGEFAHRWPAHLPDGRTLLFASHNYGTSLPSVYALDLPSGRRAALTQGAYPLYAPSGHLLVFREGTLLGAPFDPSRLKLTGALVALVGDLTGSPSFALSNNGALAHLPPGFLQQALVLVGTDGQERLVSDDKWFYEHPQFAPDGRRLAVASRGFGYSTEVWIHDLEAGVASRLTFGGGTEPLWTPDGAAVTFAAGPSLGTGELQRGFYIQRADGRGGVEQLLTFDVWHRALGWTPDGRTLAYVVRDEAGAWSIRALADGESRLVMPGARAGRLSPDGRWLAYQSDDPERDEVYVTPFPQADARWQISADGGSEPVWAADGTEVFYRSGDRLIAARVDMAAGVRVPSRRLVLEPFSPSPPYQYDVHPDGRTLAMVRPVDDPRGGEVVLILDWLTELQRLMRQ